MKHIICDRCGTDTKQSEPQAYFVGKGFDTMWIHAKDDDVHYCKPCLSKALLAIAVQLLGYDGARRLLEDLEADYGQS